MSFNILNTSVYCKIFYCFSYRGYYLNLQSTKIIILIEFWCFFLFEKEKVLLLQRSKQKRLSHCVMAAQQVLVLSVQVRILVGQRVDAQVVKLVYTLVSGTSGFTAV